MGVILTDDEPRVQSVSLRASLAVGVALNLISSLPTIFSQLRKLRTVPATVLEPPSSEGMRV